ncbi:DUF1285 domain-containing protein [Methylocapsa aurea]|uniref:DUF1285 domain-containing protein n=1 Tax=Methylocapsa aurea TaxID=663610 RepID=UPI00068BA5BF|nr:DUF1285 domain-containing protein [Methylocapsa aurea]
MADDVSRPGGARPNLGKNLQDLTAAIQSQGATEPSQKALPPVEQWSPPFCGDIDMRIARDGSWHYQGTPIGRPALVKLFSTILRKDPDRYVLVTPVERVGVTVEDAPFVAVEMTAAKETADQVLRQILRFRTNVGDWVTADGAHPLRFETAEADGIKPYIRVRGGLWALVKRGLALDLVALAEIREHEGARVFGVASAGAFFPIAPAEDVEAAEKIASNGQSDSDIAGPAAP